MERSPRILHLYTLSFPQEGSEVFLEVELPYLAESFDRLKIFPKVNTGREMMALPDNVEVIFLDSDQEFVGIIDRIRIMGSNLLKIPFLMQLKTEFSLVGQMLKKARMLSQYLEKNEKAIHYSYWFEEWTVILGELFKKGMIKGHVTRAHGFDLYDERSKIGYHPYRKIQSQGLKKIFPVSKAGAAYLKSRISGIPISTAYLGTVDRGVSPLPSGTSLELVSIARAVPLKRLKDIIKVLRLCEVQIHWTHIGDGPDLKGIQEAAADLPNNIQVEFKGKLTHVEVMESFKENSFHLLISLSESEGLPVSMMEAISFGLPILATDVGGVSEIVNSHTGILVPAQLDHQRIAEILDHWRSSKLVGNEFRHGVREFWKANFCASTNYPDFIEELKDLHCS